MNFISTFDELNKLYEEVETNEKIAFMDFTGSSRQFKDAYKKRMKADGFDGEVNYVEDTQMKALCDAVNSGADVTLYTCDDDYKVNCKSIVGKKNFKVVTIVTESIEEACVSEELTEAAEEEVLQDEEEVAEIPEEDEEIEVEDDEPKQVILECSSCGALVIRKDDELVVDEESGLANVEDACEYCEEAAGYKIIGVVMPYESEEADVITEGLADWYRRKFDKPASIKTQQAWEDELNGECGEISDKRRQQLEKKFAQQRDWEARHTNDSVKPNEEDEELEELFDADIDVSPNISLQANGNEVAVGGATI